MKVELSTAYKNIRLLEAELTHRGHWQYTALRLWNVVVVIVIGWPVLATILLVTCFHDEDSKVLKKLTSESRSTNAAPVLDDGSWVIKDSTDKPTIHYERVYKEDL